MSEKPDHPEDLGAHPDVDSEAGNMPPPSNNGDTSSHEGEVGDVEMPATETILDPDIPNSTCLPGADEAHTPMSDHPPIPLFPSNLDSASSAPPVSDHCDGTPNLFVGNDRALSADNDSRSLGDLYAPEFRPGMRVDEDIDFIALQSSDPMTLDDKPVRFFADRNKQLSTWGIRVDPTFRIIICLECAIPVSFGSIYAHRKKKHPVPRNAHADFRLPSKEDLATILQSVRLG
ncbi:hypothetical protein B0H21DRAFT_828079 [Amylocystis lapponica]|nr:hypothetical protein B0H21DRAFT_828079 [Amylocystis lapponica]